MAKKETVTNGNTDVAVLEHDQLPAENIGTGMLNTVGSLDMFDTGGPTGFEKATARDQLIPRLTILQALSPQLDESKSVFLDGAKKGDICDVGTGELFDQPVIVLPCAFDKVWIEWAPRETGQGLVAIHPTDEIMRNTHLNDKKQSVTDSGNLVQETAQWYCLNLSAGRRPCFIPFVSTQLKKSRRWMTLAQGERVARKDGSEFVPPMYFRVYQLSTGNESNNRGSWYGWMIERGPALVEYTPQWQTLLNEAKAFQKSVMEGLAIADTSSLADEGPTIDHDSNARM